MDEGHINPVSVSKGDWKSDERMDEVADRDWFGLFFFTLQLTSGNNGRQEEHD